MSVMREIEDYVLDSPIALTSSYDKLVEKLRAALLARQQYHPQLVEVYQPQIVQASGGERPRSPSDSAEEWDDAILWNFNNEMNVQCVSKSEANFFVSP